MKSVIYILAIILTPVLAWAECRVVETADRNELVCEGVPATKEEKALSDKERKEQEAIKKSEADQTEKERINEEIKQKLILDNAVRISNLDLRLVEKSKYSDFYTVSFKFDVSNPGRSGQVWFKVTLLDSRGFEMESFLIMEFFGAGQTKTVTKSRITNRTFDKWRVDVERKQ